MDNSSENSSQPLETTPPTAKQYYHVDFRAKGMEYTMLVLVNTALTILTLGIFSAWAKVRTKKYLYGNTYINGSNFNYHADPLQILKGRLIVGALFIAYAFGGRLSIAIPIIAGVLFLVASPWLFVQGMAFNLGNSSYRNLRFGFDRKFRDAYVMFLKGWLLTVVTFGLGFPYFIHRIMRFQVDHSRYGKSHFKSKFEVGDFYGIYIRMFGVYLLSFFVFGIIMGLFGVISGGNKGVIAIGVPFAVIALYAGILFAVAYVQAAQFNLIYKMSSIESVEFITSMRSGTVFKLYIQNIFIAIFTLGFGIPYGLYRLMEYRAKCISLKADPDQFEKFEAGVTSTDGVVADAATDFWDVDVGF